METYSGGLAWSFSSKKGTNGEVQLNYRFEQLFDLFELGDEITIQEGKYEFIGMRLQYTSQFSKPFSATYQLDLGEFYDGQRYSLDVTPNWAVSSSLELSGSLIYNYLVFGTIKETLMVGRLKGLYMFDTRSSISSFIQWNGASKTFLANIRFRYNPKEGNDLYIVFNDNLNADRYADDFILPVSNTRNIVLKYTHTFR